MSEAKHETALSVKRRALLVRMLEEKGIKVTSRQAIPRRERGGPTPLSYAQQRLWFLNQLEPGNPFYNMPTLVRLRGSLDAGALRRALGEVVRRHEVLRTTFEVFEGQPAQVVAPPRESELPVIEPGGGDAAEREAEALSIAGERARAPFDLSSEPPLRSVLLRLGPEEHLLSVVMHHVVSDGWSIGVFVRELEALYRAFAAGRPSPLEELPIQYADYAAWQREPARQETLMRQLDYWKRRLAGAPEVLELPTDRPRPPVQSYRGARASFSLPPELIRNIKALCASQDVTLFMLLLAAFQLLLMRHTGQERISIGCPIAGREQVETEGLIGLFINTQVMYTDLSGEPDFVELLRRVRETALGAYANQEAPFEQLVEELQPERSLSHTPLFQVMFVLQSAEQPAVSLEGLSVEQVGVEGSTAKYDLTLSATEADGTLKGAFEYNTELFDAATVERMAGRFERLLEAAAREPRRSVSRLPMLTESERHRLLYDWNDTRRDYGAPACIHQLFERQARLTPEAAAVVCGDEELSYAELNRRADLIARRLRRLGVGAESRVALLLGRTASAIAAILGVMKAGGAYVPLDPTYPQERLRFMLEDCGALVLLTQRPLLDSLPEHSAHLLCLDDPDEDDGGPEPPTVEARVLPENLAYVIYTSGSTGRPKGVSITHRSAWQFLRWTCDVFTAEDLSSTLASTSVCFDLSVFELFAPLSCGGRVVLVENALALHRLAVPVTLVNTVPSAMTELVRSRPLPESVSVVNLAGEALSPSLVREVVEASGGWPLRLYNLYGPSEDTTYSTYAEVSGRAGGPIPIGRPVANTRAYVVDAWGGLAALGCVGELYLGGEGLARGYIGRAALTAERFVPDCFSGESGARLYRTGDVVRWGDGAELNYLGRTDNQVKVRGFRIELGEIEAALLEHPAVAEAVALVRPDPAGHKSLAAYVVVRDGARATAGELRSAVAAHLPGYMVPQAVAVLERMPLTPSGKLDRKSLPAPEYGGAGRVYIAPSSELEREVAGIWQEILGAERVGIHDNFFDLGGHSLLAMRVVSAVRERLKADVPLRRLFETPTVEGLALAVSEIMEALPDGCEPEVISRAELDADEELLSRLDELSEAEVESYLLSFGPDDEEDDE
jgi:amino acid adenylation domain-containing protein